MSALRRERSARPLLVLVCPLRGAARERLARPGRARSIVALFIKDPDRIGAKANGELSRFHGLTPAEARVAASLAQGRGVVGTARVLSVSETTVKTHARHVYEKMGVGGQAELARLAALFEALGAGA